MAYQIIGMVNFGSEPISPYIFLTCGLRDGSKVQSAFVLLDWIGVSIYLCNSVCTTLTCLATYCGCWFTCIHFVYRKLYPFCRLRTEQAGDKNQMTGQGGVCATHCPCASTRSLRVVCWFFGYFRHTAVQQWTRKIPSFSSEVKG